MNDRSGLGWARFLEAADGYTYWLSRAWPVLTPPLPMLPSECRLRVALEQTHSIVVVGAGPGYAILLETGHGSTAALVAAGDRELATAVLEQLPVDPGPQSSADEVSLTVWRRTPHGTSSWERSITAPRWAEVQRNYPRAVGRCLDSLMHLGGAPGTARLMVWSGEAGTGKTSAIRALLQAWRPWCTAHLVADPERLFGDASYLIDVLTAPRVTINRAGLTTIHSRPRLWNLVICEDADDFLRTRRRAAPGAGIGRLLNLADGLLGQGSQTVVLLTANLARDDTDPAVLRPGRCLAHVEFGRFTPAEAREWLDDCRAAVPGAGLTLAELYERIGAIDRHVVDRANAADLRGAYL